MTGSLETIAQHADMLLDLKPQLEGLMQEIDAAAYSAKAASSAAKSSKFEVTLSGQHTLPKPFALSVSKRKPPPVEEPVPPPVARKPPPLRREGPTQIEKAIAAAKCASCPLLKDSGALFNDVASALSASAPKSSPVEELVPPPVPRKPPMPPRKGRTQIEKAIAAAKCALHPLLKGVSS